MFNVIIINNKLQEDFDEFCDPDNPITITYDDALDAMQRIRKYMPETPYVVCCLKYPNKIYSRYK